MNEQMELLVEFAFAAAVGTKRYALRDIITPTKYYEGRVVAFGDLEREISVVPGEFRHSGFSMELDNSDNEFSNFKDLVPFKNVAVTLLYGDLAAGESDFSTVAIGVIDQWTMAENTLSVSCLDQSLARFDQPISGVITRALFPDLPKDTPLNLMPIAVGSVSSSGLFENGALPAYLIDPAVTQAKYQYVAAQGTATVDNVYVYGVVTVSGFTVQQRTFGAQTITTIEFDADQRDADRPDEIDVTWDGGNATSNPALAYKEVLTLQGYAGGEIDTAGFDAAKDVLNVRGVTAGIAIIDKEETLRTVAEKCAQSFNMSTVSTLDSKVSVTVPQPGATVPSAPLVDESQIVQASFGMVPSEELVSSLEYEFSCHWVEDEFQDRVVLTNAAQQSKIGKDIRRKAEMFYAIHPTGAAAVATDKMFFQAEERVVMTILADPVLFKTIQVGSDIRLTHFTGLGASGLVEQLCRCVSAGLTFDGLNFMSRFRLVDLTEANFAFTKEFERYADERTGVWTDAIDFPNRKQPETAVHLS